MHRAGPRGRPQTRPRLGTPPTPHAHRTPSTRPGSPLSTERGGRRPVAGARATSRAGGGHRALQARGVSRGSVVSGACRRAGPSRGGAGGEAQKAYMRPGAHCGALYHAPRVATVGREPSASPRGLHRAHRRRGHGGGVDQMDRRGALGRGGGQLPFGLLLSPQDQILSRPPRELCRLPRPRRHSLAGKSPTTRLCQERKRRQRQTGRHP
jgi:hypothetical protein